MKKNVIRTLIFTTLITIVLSMPAAALDDLKTRVLEIEVAFAEGNIDTFVDKYEVLVKENPDDPDIHYLLGWAYFRTYYNEENPDYLKAINEFSNAKALDPSLKSVNFMLGNIYLDLREYEKSIQAYRDESILNPDQAWIFINMGLAYEGLHEYNKAMSQYIIAIDKDPSIPEAHNNLGAIAMEWKGDSFRALDEFKMAIDLDPKKPLYRENYNKAVRKLKELRESLEKGELDLPSDKADKLRNMELKEVDVEG